VRYLSLQTKCHTKADNTWKNTWHKKRDLWS